MTKELTKTQKLTLIHRHTHKDFKGSNKSILMMRNGATCLVPVDALTDAEIEDRLPRAKVLEADRLKKAAAKKEAVAA